MLETLQEDVSHKLSWEEQEEGEREGTGEDGEEEGEGESTRKKGSYRKSHSVEKHLEGCLFCNPLMTTHLL